MVRKCDGNKWLLIISLKYTIQKRRKCVHTHACIHIEKHILDKEKYQSQLNVVLLVGSHTAANILTAVLFSLCNVHVVCKDKEGI